MSNVERALKAIVLDRSWATDIGAQGKQRHVFPYSVLEIKLREGLKAPKWFSELVTEGLVLDVPKFSKFLHGVVMLRQPGGEMPYWLSEDPLFASALQGGAAQEPQQPPPQPAAAVSAAAARQPAQGAGLGRPPAPDRTESDGFLSLGAMGATQSQLPTQQRNAAISQQFDFNPLGEFSTMAAEVHTDDGGVFASCCRRRGTGALGDSLLSQTGGGMQTADGRPLPKV